MMTLIAMGITVAYIYSVYSFIANLLNPHTRHGFLLGIGYFDRYYATRSLD